MIEHDNQTSNLVNLIRKMELSIRETFEQMREDNRQSELILHEHIQRLDAREDERWMRRRTSSKDSYGDNGGRRRCNHGGNRRRNSLPRRQPPLFKIPKFNIDNDPNIYLEWEKKVDQVFNVIYLVSKSK